MWAKMGKVDMVLDPSKKRLDARGLSQAETASNVQESSRTAEISDPDVKAS